MLSDSRTNVGTDIISDETALDGHNIAIMSKLHYPGFDLLYSTASRNDVDVPLLIV